MFMLGGGNLGLAWDIHAGNETLTKGSYLNGALRALNGEVQIDAT
jgi:hypothetical protein